MKKQPEQSDDVRRMAQDVIEDLNAQQRQRFRARAGIKGGAEYCPN